MQGEEGVADALRDTVRALKTLCVRRVTDAPITIEEIRRVL